MRRCPDCQTENPVEAPFCSSCGLRFDHRVSTVADTIPEGHPAVPKRPKESGRKPQETTHEIEPVSLSDEDSSSKVSIVVGALIPLLILAGVIAWFLRSPENEVVDLSENRVQLAGGDVELGLPDDARALILLACERLEQSKEACEEATLFSDEPKSQIETVGPFSIDAFEVTNAEFEACVDKGACSNAESCKIYTHEGKQFGAKVPKALNEPSLPKVCVSHESATNYCKSVGGTLPTPAQFVFAGRAATKRIFPWGNHWDPGATNWAERDLLQTPVLGQIDGFSFTAPRRSHLDGCTSEKVCALSGNVAEWMDDQTVRGGSWTDTPFDLRISRVAKADGPRTNVGFRCVY